LQSSTANRRTDAAHGGLLSDEEGESRPHRRRQAANVAGELPPRLIAAKREHDPNSGRCLRQDVSQLPSRGVVQVTSGRDVTSFAFPGCSLVSDRVDRPFDENDHRVTGPIAARPQRCRLAGQLDRVLFAPGAPKSRLVDPAIGNPTAFEHPPRRLLGDPGLLVFATCGLERNGALPQDGAISSRLVRPFTLLVCAGHEPFEALLPSDAFTPDQVVGDRAALCLPIIRCVRPAPLGV